MKNLIIGIVEQTGMSIDTFYMIITPILTTLILPVLTALITWIKTMFSVKYNRNDELLNLYWKEENNYFYVYILLIELGVFIFSIVLSMTFSVIVCVGFILLNIGFGNMLSNNICYILTIAISVMFVKSKIFKIKFVREKFLKKYNQIEKCLIYVPIIILNLWLTNDIYFHRSGINIALQIFLFGFGVAGMVVFKGDYIKYQYSRVIIYTNVGTVECEDISMIEINKNVVRIKNNDRKIHIRKSDICKVEYYGPPLIKLKEKIVDIKKLLQNKKKRK